MAVESSGVDAGVLSLLSQSNKNADPFSNILGIAAIRMLMPGYGLDGGARPLTANDVQNIVNDAQSAATANSNFGILLKDIQDSSQGTDALIASTSANTNQTVLQGQIANLQGQAHILAGVESAKGTIVNEIHESEGSLSNAITTVNRDVLISRYELDKAITNDGDKTRNAIAHLQASLPNAREVDLQRQLAVAQDAAFEERVNRRIESGNVSVITNVNQNQAQTQLQAQLQGLVGVVGQLANHQMATANNLNILGTQRGINQTPVNVNQ